MDGAHWICFRGTGKTAAYFEFCLLSHLGVHVCILYLSIPTNLILVCNCKFVLLLQVKATRQCHLYSGLGRKFAATACCDRNAVLFHQFLYFIVSNKWRNVHILYGNESVRIWK